MSAQKGVSSKKFILLFLVLVLLCVAAIVVIGVTRTAGERVCIYQGGELVDSFPLNRDRTERYESENGAYNIVIIENGTVRVSEASCPDKICVHHAPTDQTADPIVCLPNQLVVEVVGKESAWDGVAS